MQCHNITSRRHSIRETCSQDVYCFIDIIDNDVITARKRSLRRLCFYRCVSVHRGGSASVHAGRPPCQGDPPVRENPLARETPLPPARETPLCQGDPPRRPPCQGDPPPGPHPRGNWGGSGPVPHPRGKLRGIRSRPTPKGEIQGDQVQANIQRGNLGGSGPNPPMTTAAGGTHPTRMHSCCLHTLQLKFSDQKSANRNCDQIPFFRLLPIL